MKLFDLFSYPFYKQCLRMFIVMMVVVFLCKITSGAFAVALVMIGIWGAMTKRPAYALICFAVLPFMTIMNSYVFGFGGMLGLSARLGMPAIAVAMLVAASQRTGRQALPLISMAGYVAVAIVSSINGYCPMVSYMKLINFSFFLLGIYVGTKNIDRNIKDLELLRAFFFAFSFFIVAGSFVLNYTNPFAAHAVLYGKIAAGVGGIEAAKDAMYANIASSGSAGFLCGVVNHSQCLGPTTACIAGWLLCDMLFIEKRFMIGHVLLLILCPIVLYMTMSRTSLLAFVAVVFIISIYCVPKFRVRPQLKRKIRSMLTTSLLLLLLGAIFLELSERGVSKWLLKYEADTDMAISVDQLTKTRMGVIEEGLYDFNQNQLFGKGFQVAFEHQYLDTDSRFILSAPIEKGFIPTMILGETGVAGAVMFSIFLIAFFGGCMAKKYWVTLALFATFLVTNLGEATFFSPGGTGGPEWLISLVGAFVIDMCVLVRNRQEKMMMGPLMR